jgi:superfamily II DNA or RNA helicase
MAEHVSGVWVALSAYADFLTRKRSLAGDVGFEVEVSEQLYGFQREIVRFAARKGRAAIFADCGLGKTPMQLEWARLVREQTSGNVLILAPLAVAAQTVREGAKFGIEAVQAREAHEISPITVTNYERLERFADMEWAGVVLDESSILKSFDGRTRELLTRWADSIPYRLCATATPSPNDYEELGGHAEFLGVLNRRQMLAEFFINDGLSAAHWRLKGHAQHLYWHWIRSWAAALRSPADLGYPDDGFALPPLNVDVISIDADAVSEDRLFAVPVSTLAERRQARRESLPQRVGQAAEIVNATAGPCVVWCDLNDESAALARAIPDALEVTGSDSADEKEARLLAFTNGDVRVLVTKPRIGGWGLNWQHCNRMVFVGLSDSYESYYQAVRRCWRFGQTQPVEVTIIASNREQTVLENVRRKEEQARSMFEQLVAAA